MQSKAPFALSLALSLSLTLAACGDDDVSTDAAVPTDVPLVDAPADGAMDSGADASSDGGADAGPVECTFPAMRIAGTPETDALANAPARCGAPEYAWLRSEELGSVLRLGEAPSLDLSFVLAVLAAEGVDLSPAPTHTTAMQQFAYTTQDRGELVEATALVAFPTDLDAAAPPSDVLLLLHGTSGFSAECGTSEDATMQAIATLFAGYGYVTVIPDYLGLGFLETAGDAPHPYLVGEATAIASLDAIRAASNLEPIQRGDACMSPRVAIYGPSQGGHAALWVDRLAAYYAPELEMMGTVAAVPPAGVIDQTERVFSTLVSGTGNLSAALITMAPWYGYEDRLDELFVAPWDAELPMRIDGTCDFNTDDLPETIEGLLQPAIIEAASSGTFSEVEPWGCMLRESDLTATSIARLDAFPESYGILFITGEEDELVHTPIERVSYNALCDADVPLQYLECQGAGHSDAAFWSLGESIRFIADRFAEEPFAAACPAAAPSRCEGTPE